MAGWIRGYERSWLRSDLIAGVAVAALIVPKNLGYAGIAGIPLQNGLYAAAAGAIIYAIFGTSRQISTGPSSGLAAVAASAVAVAGVTGTQNVAAFVAMITLVSGLLFLLLAVLKMDLDEHPGDEQYPGVVVLRLDGGLFFATSDALEDRVREVALSTSRIAGIVLDCEGIDFIDSQGSAKLHEVLGLARQAGITLRLARVKPAVHDLLACDGVLDDIGAENIHGNIDHAVTAQLATTGDSHADL